MFLFIHKKYVIILTTKIADSIEKSNDKIIWDKIIKNNNALTSIYMFNINYKVFIRKDTFPFKMILSQMILSYLNSIFRLLFPDNPGWCGRKYIFLVLKFC